MALCKCGCGATVISDDRGRPRSYILGHNPRKHCQCLAGKRGPEYCAYHNAKARCSKATHPSWKNYGGRGIKFLFVSFEQFYAVLGPRPKGLTLERIDNEGNYEQGNVKWASRSEQQKNRHNLVALMTKASKARWTT